MKLKFLFSLCILGFVMSGCDDNTSPASTAKAAAANLYQNKFKSFRRLLSDDAAVAFETRSSFENLRDTLSGKPLELSSPVFIHGHPVDSGGHIDFFTIQAVNRADHSVAVALELRCDFEPTTCLYGSTVIPNCIVTESEQCSIDQITLSN